MRRIKPEYIGAEIRVIKLKQTVRIINHPRRHAQYLAMGLSYIFEEVTEDEALKEVKETTKNDKPEKRNKPKRNANTKRKHDSE